MRRRDFIGLLGTGVVLPILSARAAQAAVRRIAFLSAGAETDPQISQFLEGFRKGLRENGWIEGRNLEIEFRWTAGDPDRASLFAKELVDLKPDLIVSHTTPATSALHRATSVIPIVFVVVSDPIGNGFVSSLSRPGGNVTGFVNLEASMASKWVELAKEVAPRLKRIAILFNPDTAPYAYYEPSIKSAAQSQSVDLVEAPIHSAGDIESALQRLDLAADGGIVVMPDAFTALQQVYSRIIEIAARDRIPAIYPYRYMAVAGGLMSYGTDNGDLFRRAAAYVDRILKGAKPAELPVQLPTKFEFIINVRTAQLQGFDIPLKLRAFADDVIE
jgi:putative tryptophan/tyrosine transport system substrate-binding protein